MSDDAVAALKRYGYHEFDCSLGKHGHAREGECDCGFDAALAALARVGDGETKRRIECASCHKAPTDDPSLALTRFNRKGVPGVFLCQWCVAPAFRAALTGGRDGR